MIVINGVMGSLKMDENNFVTVFFSIPISGVI